MNEPKPTTEDLQRVLASLEKLPATHTAAPMSVGMAIAVLRECIESRLLVWSDSCVNLAVFDANGVATNRTSVLLLQEGNERPASGFCEWMPYQKGQAAKAEALEAEALCLSAR